jgi:hypothetical protein
MVVHLVMHLTWGRNMIKYTKKLVSLDLPYIMGATTIKGVKTLVDYNEKLYFYYFEKSPIIIYNDLFVHILGFSCLFMKLISYKFEFISLCY